MFPLTDGGETIGALALYTTDLESYSSDHLHLLESVSRLASTALQHAMLHEQTKASARTDALTGLPNGRALYARLDHQLAQAAELGSSLTVLCFNLTGLRAVNEFFGYQAGDRMLAEVAGQLRQEVGEAGMLSRIAGDEFICLLSDASRDEATRLGEQAQNRINAFRLEVRPEQFAFVGLDVGAAAFPTDGSTTDELLHAASVATRNNKASAMADRVSSKPSVVPLSCSSGAKSGPLALVG